MYEVIHDGKDRASWLQARKQGIGGSDAPIVLGVSPWKSPLDLYVEKISDEISDFGNEATLWGNLLEPLILHRFGEVTKRLVRHDGRLLRSRANDWQLATLDGCQVSDNGEGLVEIKATSLKDNWEQGPPPYVIAQVQHQLAVTGYQFGSVAALFSGKDFGWWDIRRDEDFITYLLEQEESFWWRVLSRTPPDPETGDKRALSKLFPTVEDPEPILLEEKFAELDAELQKAKADEKEISKKIDFIENQFRMAIGAHAGGRLTTGIMYSNKLTHRESYVVPASDYRTLRRVKGK